MAFTLWSRGLPVTSKGFTGGEVRLVMLEVSNPRTERYREIGSSGRHHKLPVYQNNY